MRLPVRARPLIVAASTLTIAVALCGCSADTVHHATSLGSSVATDVASHLDGISGDAIQKGMASVAGGIDGAIDTALRGANVTTDGRLPNGFPSAAVPLVDGTVLGGGVGPKSSGWVVQLRVASLEKFREARARLGVAGFGDGTTRTGANSAFGLFQSDDYRVLVAFSRGSSGITATYIVTPR